MENPEGKILNKYKLWQELFEKNSDDSKNTDKNYLLSKDFNSSCSSCSGCRGGCKGCTADKM